MKKLYLSTLLLIGITTSLLSQKYDIKRYSVNEGLPSGQVYDVAFSQDGYVWFATSYGLVKSDGKQFTVYDRKNGLKDEIINDLFIDADHNLWVATSNLGVGVFENDTLVSPSYLDALNDKRITYIIQSPKDEIWFGTNENGIFIWNTESNELDELAVSEALQSKTIWDIYFDKEGNSWIATHGGVTVLDPENNVINQIDNNTGLAGRTTYQVFEDSKGNKWIPTNEGVSILSTDNRIRNISELNGTDLGYVYNISEDKYGRIWIGTERKGIFWYTEDKVTQITKENGLSSNYIYRFIKDSEETIWVATEGNGVSVFKDTRFSIYDKESEFGATEVFGVLKDSKGVLWFANEKGLSNYKNGKFTTFSFPLKYKGEEIWDLEELPNGNILMLPYESPLIQFDGKNFTDFQVQGIRNTNYSTDLFLDDDGSLLMAGEGGVLKYKNGVIDSIKVEGVDYWASYVNVVYKDKDGFYWFGTDDGVVKYNGEQKKRFNSDNGVEGSSVYEIKEDALGNIWLGTNRGISILTKSTNRDSILFSRSFELEDKYLGETIFLQFDGQAGVWQGTNAGLNYYNLHSWDSRMAKNIHFALQDYGKGMEFNGSASLMDDDGNLWFGTANNGLVKFDFMDRGRFKISSNPPDIFIHDFIANNRSSNSNPNPFYINEPVTLGYQDNNIEIQFGGVNFKEPNRVYYKYRLLGFQEEFVFRDDINNVFYTNLESGKYEFQVFAKSPNSEWSKQPAIIRFVIDKPYWFQWWFILLIIGLLAFIFVAVVKSRVQYIEKRKLKRLVDEQTKELQAGLEEKEVLIKEIHHRVKNNLAVISGLLEMQTWNLENEEAKNALTESKLRVFAMAKIHENLYQNKNLGRIDFNAFLEALKDGIASTMGTERKDVQIELEVRSGLIRVDQAIPCGLIINELITNCYKHAFNDQEEKIISIKFKEDEKNLNLSVADNGVGINENILESKGKSLGLTLIKSLSTQLEGDLKVENDNGTVFKLTIPNKSLVSSLI